MVYAMMLARPSRSLIGKILRQRIYTRGFQSSVLPALAAPPRRRPRRPTSKYAHYVDSTAAEYQ